MTKDNTDSTMGFNSCGVYYRMIDYEVGYLEYLKSLIIEIKSNSLKNKKL